MAGWAILFAVAALTVKEDGAELRASCDPGEPVVATLAAGTPATVRFAMNGCYAVDVERDGAKLRGYLRANQVIGADAWDASRRGAPGINTPTQPRSGPAAGPLQTLDEIERALVVSPRNPQLLALAGLAAYRSDQVVRAIGYLKDSLALRPDPAVQQFLDKLLREQGADHTGEPLHSSRFVFRFDPAVMPAPAARTLLAVLEQEYSRIAFELGCNNTEKLAVIAQTREDYLRSTGAAEWSGAVFDGRIRAALLESDPGGALTRRMFAHELVHACLSATGAWPAWLHEGLAQKLSGDSTSEPRRAAIRAAARANALPGLAGLSQSWSRMSNSNAAVAYATSLYAVELFYQHHAAFGIRNLLRNPEQLPNIVTDLDRRLRE